MALKMTFFRLLNQLTTQVVTDTPSLAPMMETLQGRSIKLTLTDIGQSFFWINQAWCAESQGPFDAILSGSSVSVFFAGVHSMQGQPSLEGIRIEGDMHLALAMQKILQQVKIDPGQILERYVGETPAEFIELGLRFAKQIGQSLHEGIKDHAKGKNWLVSRSELETFYQDVDTFVADVDRLEARQRLENTSE